MNIIFYTIIFLIGSVIGGLWAVKSREIPRELDLKKTHYSNNPKSELISELTYILIGGVSTGVLANIFNINFNQFDISNMIIYVFAMLYVSTLVLIAGIDRIYTKIDKKTLSFGIISSILYMLHLCIVDLASIHLSIIYFGVYMILLVIDSFLLRKFAKDSYIVNLLLVLTMTLVFTDLHILVYTLIMSLVAVGLYVLLLKLQKKKNGYKKIKIKEIPVGFFVSASVVIVLFMVKIFENYVLLI